MSFLEAGSFSSESELDYFVWVDLVIETLAALLDDSLHVGPLASDYSSRNLELLFVVDLNVIPAGVFDVRLFSRFNVYVIFFIYIFKVLRTSTELLEVSWVESRSRQL